MPKKVNFRHISVHDTPEESPGFLLWCVSIKWRTAIEKVLKPLGLTHPQFVILATTGWLTRNGLLVSQIDIGRKAGLDPNTTSQIIRGLESKQLIIRTQTFDERSKNPALTAAGTAILKQALPLVEAADHKFFTILSPIELCDFINVFQKLN